MNRDALLADASLDRLAQAPGTPQTTPSFLQARVLRDRGATDEARATLEALLTKEGLTSRQRLQIWSALRELGATPDRTLLEPLGVVVEVGLDEGLDVLAAYDDRQASYVNYSGGAVVWVRPNASLDAPIDALLDAARALPPLLSPWRGPQRAPAARGEVRVNVVTPSGLYFGEGPHEAMVQDPMGGPVLLLATSLMTKLTRLVPPKVQ